MRMVMSTFCGRRRQVSSTATLARALKRADPSVEIEYVLDTCRLRPQNVDMTMRMGYRPRLLPPISRANRAAVTQACLGDADVIVDYTSRYLFPLRAGVPRAAWVSIPRRSATSCSATGR